MARLKAALLREYEDDTEYQMQVHNPRNTVAVELHFRGEKMAKVLAIDRGSYMSAHVILNFIKQVGEKR